MKRLIVFYVFTSTICFGQETTTLKVNQTVNSTSCLSVQTNVHTDNENLNIPNSKELKVYNPEDLTVNSISEEATSAFFPKGSNNNESEFKQYPNIVNFETEK